MAGKVGDYGTTYWEYTKKPDSYAYEFVPPRPSYRERNVTRVVEVMPHSDPYYAARGYTMDKREKIEEDAIVIADMTIANATVDARKEQSRILEHLGYRGPVGGGEARMLRNLFNELGMPNLVKHGWVQLEVEVMAQPTRWQSRQARWNGTVAPKRKVMTTQLKKCYLFKSPMESVPFDKWIKLARLYKEDKGGLRVAVNKLLANPEAHKEIEALDTIDLLANLGGSDD